MRILKRMLPLASAESAAVAERLKAITSRGKVERSFYDISEEPLKPQGRPRLFWTPVELAVESSGD
jgi:hypothetical protein